MIKMEITNAVVTPMRNGNSIHVIPVTKEGSSIHSIVKFNIETKKSDSPNSNGKVWMNCTIFSKTTENTEKFKTTITEGTILSIKGAFSVDVDKNDKTKKYNVCEVQEIQVLSKGTPQDTGYSEGTSTGDDDTLPF